jgi:hypothetical protein
MSYEFCGIKTEQYNEQDREQFTEVSDYILIKNKPFKVELENKEVELYTYIENLDMSEYEDGNTSHIITIGVIPSFTSLSEKNRDSILSQFTDDDKPDNEQLLLETLYYGCSIQLRNETVEPEEVEQTIKSAIATHSAVEGLIGFELDRYVNRIGNTGWDYLDDYCNDKNLLDMALSRVEN